VRAHHHDDALDAGRERGATLDDDHRGRGDNDHDRGSPELPVAGASPGCPGTRVTTRNVQFPVGVLDQANTGRSGIVGPEANVRSR
jgi:hypothetical protein